MEEMTLYTFQDLRDIYGTQQNICTVFGVDPAAVTRWKQQDKIPSKRQLQFMHLLDNDGRMKRQLAVARRARGRAAKRMQAL